MTAISAGVVKELREKTGAGMMECKKALTESSGDFEKAIDLLRQKGLASAAKKAARSASQGLISIASAGGVAVITEMNCETDFVARTDDFRALVEEVGSLLLTSSDSGQTAPRIEELIKEKIAKLGENIVFRRSEKFDLGGATGGFGVYIHMDKIGVLVEALCDHAAQADTGAFKTMMKDIAMHIAAANPSYVSRANVPQDILEREKEIYRGQVAGKPANVIDKIVDGKVEKFYSDVCLIDQIFVKDPDGKKKVKDILAENAKQTGGNITIRRFLRFQLGEGQPSEPASC
jgi:elongation factor Ts